MRGVIITVIVAAAAVLVNMFEDELSRWLYDFCSRHRKGGDKHD